MSVESDYVPDHNPKLPTDESDFAIEQESKLPADAVGDSAQNQKDKVTEGATATAQ